MRIPKQDHTPSDAANASTLLKALTILASITVFGLIAMPQLSFLIR